MSIKTNPRPPRSIRNTLPALAAFLLIGCGCSFFQTGATDEPSNGSFPLKPGHWSHESDTRGEATVSFDLSGDGEITNFQMTASFGTPTESCTFSIDRIHIDVQRDGVFKISYFMDYEEVSQQLGQAVMKVFGSTIPEGEPYEVLHISGKATDTSMEGTYQINVCGPTLFLADNTGSWKAEWDYS